MKTIAKKISGLLSVIILISFTFSCKTTQIISSWSAESAPQNLMNKVLVLGVMQNREINDNIENAMTQELNLNGINAIPATSVFGPKRFKGLNEDEIMNKLKKSDFTSAIIVYLIDKEKEENFTPGTTYTSPRVVGYNRFYKRYIVRYDRIQNPGYYTTSTNYVMEADLYSLDSSKDDGLIYSAQTRSYDPSDSRSLGLSFAKSIVQELKLRGLIK